MGDAILSILLELCKLLMFISVCTYDVQIYFPRKTVSERSKEETGQKKMSGWLSWCRRVFGSQKLLSLEGQLLRGNLRWKRSPGALMCGMPSVLGAEPGAGLGSRDSGPAPASHLASCPSSFSVFQHLVC